MPICKSLSFLILMIGILDKRRKLNIQLLNAATDGFESLKF